MKRTRRQDGFTLLEVMVVVVIIAVISGFSVLALKQATGRRYTNQADNLHVWLQQLSELAVLEATAYGVVSSDNSLLAMVFYRKRWHRAAQPEPYPLNDNAQLQLKQVSTVSSELFQQDQNSEEENLPDFIFLPNGFIEPVTTMELFFPGQVESFLYQRDEESSQLVMSVVVGGQ